MKALRTVLPILSFKSLTHAYLVKTSMTPSKCLICCPNIVFKSHMDFLLLNFLYTDLCNSSASCSFTRTPDLVFLLKNL